MERTVLKVSKIINKNLAVTTDEGDLLFQKIDENFEKKIPVTLDFSDLELIISAFLNAAIGQLYGKYSGDFLRKHIFIQDLSPEDTTILIKVIERAKQYFLDNKSFDNTINLNTDA